MGATTTLRVDPETRDRLKRVSRHRNVTTAALLADLAIQAEHQILLEGFNASFAELRSDEQGWSEHVAETAAWDGTLGDTSA